MRIFVDEQPKKPDECLFSVKKKTAVMRVLDNDEAEPIYNYYCSTDGNTCVLDGICECCYRLKTLK